MDPDTFKQAIRDAIESEYAGARFFRELANKDVPSAVREFFLAVAAQEQEQAVSIEAVTSKLVVGIPRRAQPGVSWSHTAPGWEDASTINIPEALEVAQECEYAASLYYDALADWCPQAADFFHDLARTEENHAHQLRELMDRAWDQSAQPSA